MLDSCVAEEDRSNSGGKSAAFGPFTGDSPNMEGEACGDRRGSLRALGDEEDVEGFS